MYEIKEMLLHENHEIFIEGIKGALRVFKLGTLNNYLNDLNRSQDEWVFYKTGKRYRRKRKSNELKLF